MIKIRKGTSRIVFIILDRLVIKLPNPKFGIIKRKFHQRKDFKSFLHTAWHTLSFNIIHGLAANISEGLIYRVVGKKAPYLTPIYTTVFVNFCRYEGSWRPTREEVEDFYRSLPETSRMMLDKCDSHVKAPGNWRKTKKGFKLIDYGADPLTTPWALFLFYCNEDITDVAVEEEQKEGGVV